MTMPTPPPDDRAPGQTGHIADHNTISDALSSLETAVGELENTVGNTVLALPLTTIGDTLFENSAPALARLPGNTTTARMFLRQQGNGSVSAAPAWDTLEAGDIAAAGAVTLGGDIGGTTSAPLVEKIQGTAIQAPPGGATAFLRADGQWSAPPGTGGGGAVSSVFGRAGAVAPVSGDYSVSQVTGAAPLANPTFTGTPAGPTASPGTSTTQIATTAFVTRAVAGVLLQPSGDTSGATDVAAINQLLANGDPVQLAVSATPFYINAPIVISTWPARLWGGQWYSASQNDNYDPGFGQPGGSVIQAVPAFAGSTPSGAAGPSAIQISNPTGTQWYGIDLAGFTLNCQPVTTPGIYGILCSGAVGASFIRGVEVHKSQADCFNFQANNTSGYVPDEWIFDACKATASRNGCGFFVPQIPDAVFINCNGSECDLDGWQLGFNQNAKAVACKGENNGGNGFRFSGFSAGEYFQFIGCNSNFNGKNGWLFDAASGSGTGTVLLDGCRATNDGQNGPGYAGFMNTGCRSRVAITGGMAQGASYGAYQGGAAYYTQATGSWLAGSTAASHDDGTNTHALSVVSPVSF